MAVQQSSTIVIEELTGDKRKVGLIGAALPFQGAAWGSQMRLSTKWYVGNNAEATQQVLGPIELPSEWEGEWNTTRMIVDPSWFTSAAGAPQQAIVRASTMREILDVLFNAGTRLRVTWSTGSDDDARSIMREGRAAEWTFKHIRMDDIQWQIKFEWISRGRVMQRAIALRGEDVDAAVRDAKAKFADAVSKALSDQASAKQSKRAQNPPATTFTLGDIEAFANGPMKMLQSFTRFGDAITNRLKHIGDLALKMRGLTAELAGECVDTATNAVAVCTQFCDAISQPAPETLALQNKVSNLLQTTSYFGSAEDNVNEATDSAVVLLERSRDRGASRPTGSGRTKSSAAPADIIGVWIARKGDTYASISLMFYQTPDYGYAIAKVNKNSLPPVVPVGGGLKRKPVAFAVAPPVGAVLIIPNLATIKNLVGE